MLCNGLYCAVLLGDISYCNALYRTVACCLLAALSGAQALHTVPPRSCTVLLRSILFRFAPFCTVLYCTVPVPCDTVLFCTDGSAKAYRSIPQVLRMPQTRRSGPHFSSSCNQSPGQGDMQNQAGCVHRESTVDPA